MEQEINLGTKIGEISAKEIISGSFLQSMRAMLKENSYDFCNLKAIGEAGTDHEDRILQRTNIRLGN